MSSAWKQIHRMKRFTVGAMTTPKYYGWWSKRVIDNVPRPREEGVRSIEEYLRVVPSEIEIIKQDFEKRNSELGNKTEQLEEEKMHLRLDVDVQKLETEKLRTRKNKAEKDLNSLKIDYKNLSSSMKTASAKKPLPNNTDKGLNMISGNMGRKIKADIAEVRTLLKWVWKRMVEWGLISSNLEGRCEEMRDYYEFYHEEGSKIQECTEFRDLVQGMMDDKEMEFYEEVQEEGSICASEPTTRVSKINHPVVIISRPRNNEAKVPVTPKIIIKKPATFPYKDNKKVPWNYACNTTIQGREILASTIKEDQGMGSYMRSGKRYDLISPPAE
ncbi:hypothetical protein Gotur_028091, partial [Gossypium turneri]